MDSMDEEAAARHRKAVGERVAKLRLARGLTQPQLALAAGIAQPSLSDIENGLTVRVTAQTFIGICRALATTWEYLWDGGEADQARADAQSEAELVAIFRGMQPQAREAFLTFARGARGVHDAVASRSADMETLRSGAVPRPTKQLISKKKQG